MENAVLFMVEYWFVFALFGLPLVVLLGKMGLDRETNKTIAAVYRAALDRASTFKDEGVHWIWSDEGKAFRRELAIKSYAVLPDRIGGIPTGLIRLAVSEAQWIVLVDHAFAKMVELAGELSV